MTVTELAKLTVGSMGKVKVDVLEAGNIDANTSGSGNIVVKRAKARALAKLRVSSMGAIKFDSLETDVVDAVTSGMGDIKIGDGRANSGTAKKSSMGKVTFCGAFSAVKGDFKS